MLTAAEQAELDLLEAEIAKEESFRATQSTGLTAEEQAELDLLEKDIESEEAGQSSFINNLITNIDKYTGAASTRSSAMALLEGRDPLKAFSQGYSQPEKAPTGEQIAAKMGFSQEPLVTATDITVPSKVVPRPGRNVYQQIGDEQEVVKPLEEGAPLGPSPSQLTGIGLDMALDPSLAAGKVLKGIRAASEGLKLTGIAKSGVAKATAKLNKLARQKAFEAAGPMLGDFRKIKKTRGNDFVETLGKRIIDDDLIKAGDSVKNIAERSSDRLDDIVDSMRSLKSEVGQKVEFVDFEELAKTLKKELSGTAKGIGAADIKAGTEKVLDDIATIGTGTFDDIIEQRQIADEYVNFAKRMSDMPADQKIYYKIRTALNDKAEEILRNVDKYNGTDLAKRFRDLNRDYSEVRTIFDIADDKASREAANMMMGLSDRQAGIGAATVMAAQGKPVKAAAIGVASAAASKILKSRGNSVAAKFINRIAKISESSPDALGKYMDILERAAAVSPERYAQEAMRLKRDRDFRDRVYRATNERKK